MIGFLIVSGAKRNPRTRKESFVTVADINTRCLALEYDPKSSSLWRYGWISKPAPPITHWQCSRESFNSGHTNFKLSSAVAFANMAVTSELLSVHAQYGTGRNTSGLPVLMSVNVPAP